MKNNIIDEDIEQIVRAPLPWNKFAGKTVLITGANGFIAAYMAKTLLRLNEIRKKYPTRVICLVRNKEKANQRFSRYLGRKDIIFWVQDVCKPIPHKERVNYIIHAASHATPSKYGIDPVGTLLPNTLGTYMTLEFARRQKITSYLFVSVGEVYSNLPVGSSDIKEEFVGRIDSLNVRSCYAESKKMGETMCVSWMHQYNVPVKIVRLFHTYGPGMQLHDGRVHSDFVGDIVMNKDIIIKSDGRAVRTFSYVADSVTGIFTVILKGSVGEAYNIGSNKTYSISDFASLLISLYPELKLNLVKDTRSLGNSYLRSPNILLRPNLRKIKSLGWRAMFSLREGLMRTVASYKTIS